MVTERLHPSGDKPLADQPAPGYTRPRLVLSLLLSAALGVRGPTNEPVWPATETPQLALVHRW